MSKADRARPTGLVTAKKGDNGNDDAVSRSVFAYDALGRPTGESFCGADANQDNQVDARDIPYFVTCLVSGGCLPCNGVNE